MKRTPRSASRRASRQLDANEPSPGFAPYASSTWAGSLRMSTSSGTLACILNAISYCAIRVSISGSRAVRSLSRFSALIASIESPCIAALTPAGFEMYETASPAELNLHALELARQHAGRPLARRDWLHLPALARGDEDDEAGQVFRLGAQSVQHPRPHARPARDDRSGVHDRVRGIVIDLLGPHRSDDADLVDDAADMRKQLADHLSRLAELLEAVRAGRNR